MAHIEALDARTSLGVGAMETLYWWRNRAPVEESDDYTGLSVARLATIANLANLTNLAPPIEVEDLPGNRMRERVQREPTPDTLYAAATDVELLAAIRAEKTNALFAVGTGVLATTAPAAAAAYAIAVHHSVALGFAVAGLLAACFAMAQAVRSFVTARSLTVPDFNKIEA